MPFTHHFKPTHKEIKTYYEELAAYAAHEVSHETAIRSAFQNLLAATCKKVDWHLVPEQTTRVRGKQVRPDGTLRDDFNLHRGYWKAKDSADKLDVEIRKKIALGYPLSNTIFEDTATAVLYQNDQPVEPRFDIRINDAGTKLPNEPRILEIATRNRLRIATRLQFSKLKWTTDQLLSARSEIIREHEGAGCGQRERKR